MKECGLAASNGEAKRLIEGGGVVLIQAENEVKIESTQTVLIAGEHILRVGKRKFARITVH